MSAFEKPRVSVYEVALRDGLQNERDVLATDEKIRLVVDLVDAGLQRIEATSFVSASWIPQLADADELVARLPVREGLRFSALCPNERGLARALRAGINEIAIFLSASESHNRKNTNRSIAESLDAYAQVVRLAKDATGKPLRVRGYVSTVWGCPYEGHVPVSASVSIARKLFELGCEEISLGDTIGVGVPSQTKEIVRAVATEVPVERLALHMHDTRGTALANVDAGLDLGVRVFDSSLGGLGGCPYAPGAAGNVATEDLVNMLEGMGLDTGIDLEKLVEVSRSLDSLVGRAPPGKLRLAGVFRPRPFVS